MDHTYSQGQFPKNYKTTQNLVTTTTVYNVHIDELRNQYIGTCMIILKRKHHETDDAQENKQGS